MANTSMNPAAILKGCAFTCIVVVGGCIGLALLQSRDGEDEAARSSAPVDISSSPHSETAPAPTFAQARPIILTPGQVYQVSEAVPLLPAMSKLDAARKYARVIPEKGYFQCIQRETQYEGNWYSAQIFDGSGTVFRGYIDADMLDRSMFKVYEPPRQTTQRDAHSAYQEGRQNVYKPRTVVQPGQSVASDVRTTGSTVYIAPQSGQRYHSSRQCRGLSDAGRVTSIERNA
ncbi:MAG: hypothetical protein IT364_12915, partial [Candidatus Hydrogenedentes bacterium]|nr:hypothetical protein [Candidatus Hydrogenedentota bacterium]